jgi:hypothetical protein
MRRCVHCGVHFPVAEMAEYPSGKYFCQPHRQHAEP